MARDPAATRARIIEAAITEFAAHGLAGGRVDRIAAAAPANKKQIYVHFGSKEALFDEVLTYAIERLISQVPMTPDDLGGYAGRAFQAMATDPRVFRLATWRQLERPSATELERRLYEEKLNTLCVARPDLAVPPPEAMALLLALSQTWFLASPVLNNLVDPRLTVRRAHIEQMVNLLFPIQAKLPAGGE